MNLKTFLENNTITSVEIIPNITIINIVCGEVIYGLDVDTANIQAGTSLLRINDFVIDNNTLIAGGLSLDTEITKLT